MRAVEGIVNVAGGHALIALGSEVSAIASRELSDRAQARRAGNRKRYRNPKQVQLLSTLVRCGVCGGGVFATRRWALFEHATDFVELAAEPFAEIGQNRDQRRRNQ